MKKSILATILLLVLVLPSGVIAAPRDGGGGQESHMTYHLPRVQTANPYVLESTAQEWIVTDIIIDCRNGSGRLQFSPGQDTRPFNPSVVTNDIVEFHFNTGMRIQGFGGYIVASLNVISGECYAVWTGYEVP